MATTIQLRRDTAANWTSTNPTLAAGEPGYETDTGKLKFGDGSHIWSVLAYANTGGTGLAGTSASLFGDGSDGSLHFDGSTTILGMAPSSSVYTMTRDIYASSILIDNGVTLVGLYRIFCTGTLTNNGIIDNSGGGATTTTAGVAAARGMTCPSGAGHAGLALSSGTNAGTAAATSGSASALVAMGGKGGAGGDSNGGAGGTLNTTTPYASGFRDAVSILRGTGITSSGGFSAPTIVGLCGGSGGGSGGQHSGTGTTSSGAGGGGGGVIIIAASILTNTSGIIRANGGVGGNAAGAGTGTAGGGGGGGGGAVFLIYNTINEGTETANGGAPGTGLNAAAAASSGVAGTVVKLSNV